MIESRITAGQPGRSRRPCELLRSHPGRLPASASPAPADARQHRPALVVAAAGSDDAPFLHCVVMIPSASNRRWSGDVALPDLAAVRGATAHRLGL
jgi:hypothetical protein